MASRRKSKSWQSLQIVLLVLPLIALLLLGLYFIARDRRSVEQEARARAGEIARATLHQLLAGAANLEPSIYYAVTNQWPEGAAFQWPEDVAFFQVGPNFELLYPPTVLALDPFDPVPLLDPTQTMFWNVADRAEFKLENLQLADQAWTNLLSSRMPEPARAVASFRH